MNVSGPNDAWTQSHHLMKALLEAILLYKHQLLYDTYIYICVCVCKQYLKNSIEKMLNLNLQKSSWKVNLNNKNKKDNRALLISNLNFYSKGFISNFFFTHSITLFKQLLASQSLPFHIVKYLVYIIHYNCLFKKQNVRSIQVINHILKYGIEIFFFFFCICRSHTTAINITSRK